MMRPFATFFELVLTLGVVILVFLPSVFGAKFLLQSAKNSVKKLYIVLVFSVFLALFLLYISSLEILEFQKISRILNFALKFASLVFFVLCAVIFVRILKFLPKSKV